MTIFLDNIVDRIFLLLRNGHLANYEGGYTDYTEALARKGGQYLKDGNTAVGAKKSRSGRLEAESSPEAEIYL